MRQTQPHSYRQASKWMVQWLLRLSTPLIAVVFIMAAIAISAMIVLTIDLLWDGRINAELEFAGVVTPLIDSILIVGLLVVLLGELREKLKEVRRLASFPHLAPNPEIELGPVGEVSYLNPVAERLFPEMSAMGLSHPLLLGLAELIVTLRQGAQQGDSVIEVKVGESTYELHVSYVPEVELIRIYALDITKRKHAEEEIYILAITDSLTGIANRREFSAILARGLEHAKRYGMPMSLVMYDLDHFKRVNDIFGHDVGDYVLQAVTSLVMENIRAADVVARWGGEEFMVLMPQSDIQATRNAAEKLRLAVAGHPFDKINKLTVSFGVATFEPQDDLNSLLKRVDVALYRAKERGRNRVEILAG